MIIEFADLPDLRESLAGQQLVLKCGAFDILHEGHITTLAFSKLQGDAVIAGVLPDDLIRQHKGQGRPVRAEQSRLQVVDALSDVDYSFIMPTPHGGVSSTMLSMRVLRPNKYVEHTEHILNWWRDMYILKAMGVELVPDLNPKVDSTTKIIRQIQAMSTADGVK